MVTSKTDWIRFTPHVKTRAYSDFEVKLLRSGYIAVSPKVHKDWLGETKKVDLFFRKQGSTKEIGIGRVGENSGGLAVFTAGKGKARYISAKRFFEEAGISVERNMALACDLDAQDGKVVAIIDEASSGRKFAGEGGGNGIRSRRREGEELEHLILQLVPANSSGTPPKSISQINEETRERTPIEGKWGPRKKERHENRVRHKIQVLEKQGKLIRAQQKGTTGKRIFFYST